MNHGLFTQIALCLGLYLMASLLGFVVIVAVKPTAASEWFRNLMANGKHLLSLGQSRENAMRRSTPALIQVQGVVGSAIIAIVSFQIIGRIVGQAPGAPQVVAGTILVCAAGFSLSVGVGLLLAGPSVRSTARRIAWALIAASLFLVAIGTALSAT